MKQLLPISTRQNFGPDQTESICRRHIKYNKNDIFFDRAEHIVGKGEIACTSNFSFTPQYFQKASFPDPSKGVVVWEWDNVLPELKIKLYKHCSVIVVN